MSSYPTNKNAMTPIPMASGEAPLVLIVDDMPKNIKLIEAYFAPTGYNTITASDGEEALQKIAENPPDLVLLDVMMPKIDGFEVCRHIKSEEKTRLIPVVMVTALDQIEDKVRGIDAGADDFLTKPVNKMELLARTKSLIKTKRLNNQVMSLQKTLASLFELTTFTKRFSDKQLLLAEFSKKAADLAHAHSVAITFWQGDDYVVEASYNLTDEVWQQEHHGLDNAIREVLTNRELLVVHNYEEEKLSKYGLYSGYIGVPLVSFTNQTIGAINAFGISDDIEDEAVRLLTIVAQRIGYELQLKDYNAQLAKEVDIRTTELRKAMGDLKTMNVDLVLAQEETVFRLAKAAEYRDEDTAAHLHRMSNYTYVVAQRMGLENDFCDLIKVASTMHDVGKIGIPDNILLKPGRLTTEEFETIKTHPLIGAKILGGSSSELLRMSERIALAHHEKFDGSGYPHQLVGKNIPLESRIVAIADVFDALTTKRVYKRAFTVDEALSILAKDVGAHFDPEVYNSFIDSVDEILGIKAQFPELDIPYQ